MRNGRDRSRDAARKGTSLGRHAAAGVGPGEHWEGGWPR